MPLKSQVLDWLNEGLEGGFEYLTVGIFQSVGDCISTLDISYVAYGTTFD